MLRHSACAALLIAGLAALVTTASAQSLPSVSSLSGAYAVRYLGVNSGATTGDVAVAFSGTFTFDGKGGFTVTGQGTTGAGPLLLATSGLSYSVYSNGMVEILNPFDNSGQSVLYGGLGSNGVIFASSTESYYVDMFVAIPQSSGASNATLSGTYNVASMEFLAGSLNATRDTMSSFTADGKGTFGSSVTIQGTSQSLNGTASTQTSSGATYSINANGTGTLTLPAPTGVSTGNVLLSGTKVLAVSSDGKVFIAGNQTGFDFVIGLKAASSSTQQLSGYYFAGYLNNYAPGTTDATVYAAEGAVNEIPALQNLEIAHQRTNSDYYYPYDAIYADTFAFTNGFSTISVADNPDYAGTYAIGANGDMVIGSGLGANNYQLVFYVRAPAMNAPAGTSVFLNPQGVVNAASSAPFTAQYSPGEVVTLYGTGLAASDFTLSSLPFPTTTPNGIQVKVGDGSTAAAINAPIYSICSVCSPQQISAVIPYNVSTATGYVTFQVVNNGTASNTVYGYLGGTSPGVFTVPPGGVYEGAVQHAADYSLVTDSKPAKAGETIIIYLTGLGAVSPAVTAGTAAPSTTLAQVVNPVEVYIGGVQATVAFAGLTPSVGGLYQLNVTVPSGVAAGSNVLEVLTGFYDTSGNAYLDVDAFEALIPVGQ
jgi:uncharacterized protein (TIGR03437 family)